MDRGQGSKGFPHFVLYALRFIERLQIHPELCTRAEEVCKSNGGIRRDRAAPVEGWVMRLVGTFRCRAKAAALSPNTLNSSAKCSPG